MHVKGKISTEAALTYATDLKGYCTTVQFHIALQLEVQEVGVIITVLMQM